MTRVAHIGVMGGMFDPVHCGHLHTALTVAHQLGLDEIRLVPCSRPAHRGPAQATDAQRIAMLRLACADEPGLQVDTRECERNTLSYLYDTLCSLREEMPGARLYFVLGSDAFMTLEHWYRWPELLELCHWIVVPRPGTDIAPQGALRELWQARQLTSVSALRQRQGGGFFQAEASVLALSSTLIRHKRAQGDPLRFLIPEPVLDYIRHHNLYT